MIVCVSMLSRDTAGQERYKSLAPMYYRNANCAVVVYDITQPVSYSRRIKVTGAATPGQLGVARQIARVHLSRVGTDLKAEIMRPR